MARNLGVGKSRTILSSEQQLLSRTILSSEQQLLNSMFGGSVSRPILLDRPGQFFDGSDFPVTRPRNSNTSSMFGAEGFGTRKFFLPNKYRRPTI